MAIRQSVCANSRLVEYVFESVEPIRAVSVQHIVVEGNLPPRYRGETVPFQEKTAESLLMNIFCRVDLYSKLIATTVIASIAVKANENHNAATNHLFLLATIGMFSCV